MSSPIPAHSFRYTDRSFFSGRELVDSSIYSEGGSWIGTVPATGHKFENVDAATILNAVGNDTPGQIIHIQPGVLSIHKQVLIKQNNVHFLGTALRDSTADAILAANPQPFQPTILRAASDFPANTDMVQFGDFSQSYNWEGNSVIGLMLDSNSKAQRALHFSNVQEPLVEYCSLNRSLKANVMIDGSAAGGISAWRIRYCEITAAGIGSGGWVEIGSGAGQGFCTHNFINPAGYGILDQGGGDNLYEGNYIEAVGADAANGIAGYGIYAANAGDVRIIGNAIGPVGGTGKDGIHLTPNPAGGVSPFIVQGNTIVNPNVGNNPNGAGIYFDGSATFYYLAGIISGNSIFDSGNRMVYGVFANLNANPSTTRYGIKGNLIKGGSAMTSDIQIAATTTGGTVVLDTHSDGLDNRTGLTSPDASPITILTTPASSNLLYRVVIDVFATAYTSGTATYTLTWTENGVAKTLVVTAAALNTLGTATNLINPDSSTAVTVQLTGTFTATLKVAAVAERLA